MFARTEILTPDRVRGRFATLPEAIRAQGWPALDEVRGLVLFALDNEGAVRDRYLEGHPALKDRVMFVTVAPEHPAAAWFKINDPIKDFDRIQQLVKEASWSARGPMPTRARPGPTTSPSATRPWPAGPSSSAPTIASPTGGFRTIPCGFPAGRWPGPTPSAATRRGAIDLESGKAFDCESKRATGTESEARTRKPESVIRTGCSGEVREAPRSACRRLVAGLLGWVAALVGRDEDGEIPSRRDPDRGDTNWCCCRCD